MIDTSRRKFLMATAATASGLALGAFGRAVAQGALIRSTHFGGPYQALNDIMNAEPPTIHQSALPPPRK